MGGSGENRRFGTERSAVKGAQQNHQEHRDWLDFVWELYSPVIRPIIKNERIAMAIFDMGLMSDFRNVEKMVQKTLNDSMSENLVVDGKMGKNTINALNDIPVYKVNDFMNTLKENRIEYLRGLSDWGKYGRGWTNHTNRY